jgi:hypothetical protein
MAAKDRTERKENWFRHLRMPQPQTNDAITFPSVILAIFCGYSGIPLIRVHSCPFAVELSASRPFAGQFRKPLTLFAESLFPKKIVRILNHQLVTARC